MKLETKWKLINKVNLALLLVIMLASFGAYSYGIIRHLDAAFCTGLVGIMFGIPLWGYLDIVLEKREEKERNAHEEQEALEIH